MAGEVDKDVDPVGADLGGDRIVTHAHGRAPVVGQSLEPLGDRVGVAHLGVAEELDLGPVVGGEPGADEEAGGVVAEVGGDVADAQAPVRVAVEIEGRMRRRQGAGVGGIPQPVFGEDRFR